MSFQKNTMSDQRFIENTINYSYQKRFRFLCALFAISFLLPTGSDAIAQSPIIPFAND